MSVKKPKIERRKIYQEFDLKELLGVDLSERRDLKEGIGQLLIDTILKRTAKGKDIDNAPFKSYSKRYVNSEEFKLAGKSKSKVNMKLLGDMLADLDIIENKGNIIKIGFTDQEEIDKAYNHLTAKSKKNKMPQRKFFGVNDDEFKKIKKRLEPELRAVERGQEMTEAAQALLDFIDARDAITISLFTEEGEEENGDS